MSKNIFASLKRDKLYFLPLGGCSEIGMNLNVYIYNDQCIIVDLGLTFSKTLGFDVIVPDINFLISIKDKIQGLVITHGHEDHIGAIPHLWKILKCPIYATPFTMELIKYKLMPKVEHYSNMLNCIDLGAKWSLGDFSLQMIGITHSIPEPNMICITTPVGKILHTGDWKLDDNPVVGEPADLSKIEEIAGKDGVLAVISDSTNVFEPNNAGSEMDVQNGLIDAVKKCESGMVLIACFSSNVARLKSAFIVGQKTGRKVALCGRSLIKIHDASKTTGHLDDTYEFGDESSITDVSRSQRLVVCTGSQGEPKSVLTRIAKKEHDIRLKSGDTVIFSSRIIPGNEEAINEVKNLIIAQGAKIMAGKEYMLHVSGHPCRGDLERLYKAAKPLIVFPVHGDMVHLTAHAEIARALGIKYSIVPTNGIIYEISSRGVEKVEEVQHGRMAVDGKQLVPMSSNILREREILGGNGIVVLIVNAKNRKIESLETSGLFDEDTKAQKMKTVNDCVQRTLKKYVQDKRIQNMKNALKSDLSYHIRSLYGKRPSMFVHII